ncbi:MAG: DUF981 family protein [Euryarchaeota archaeon]|nr:DUF981 family protein [Euryarchaeota archaeon]MDE1837586.1 DUF981 family protein [Euryarchaeota archaeon]MDE1881325.1 DUF981 family protein [Euryarchaeota archaeon]MDE2045897.1 DUF981 family protein [Thermoplasmata archaeon]
MTFIDDLGLIEGLLLLAGVLLTYVAVVGWFRMLKGDTKGLHEVLKGSAIPLGGVGITASLLGVWAEMVWPYAPYAYLGGYNILFTDVILLFGLVLVAFAISAYLNLKLQYVGLFALVAGAITLFYGWTGYGLNYTKEPLNMLLLYAGFGAAGIMAFPATVLVDHFMGSVETSPMYWTSEAPNVISRRLGVAVRGVQGLSPQLKAKAGSSDEIRYHLPRVVSLVLLVFPVFMALASIAAYFFLGSTIPGHLVPGKTP